MAIDVLHDVLLYFALEGFRVFVDDLLDDLVAFLNMLLVVETVIAAAVHA